MDFTEVALSKATINLDHLLNNISAFKDLLAANTKFMAVIKANAYSHGAIPLARELEAQRAADYFGVAQLSEALQLRNAGLETPILVFNSVRIEEIERAIQQNISMTVFSTAMAEEVVKAAEKLEKPAKVHLKIDTGMARLGVTSFKAAYEVYTALDSPLVEVEGIYTHFADATQDDPENFTHEQFKGFKKVLDGFEEKGIAFALRHACNTAATINFPAYHLDMVRVGFGLYGGNPTVNQQDKLKLTPIETVETTVTHVKEFPAGESVGYDRTYFSTQPMKIATIAMGYADGVAMSLSNKGYFTYKGHRLPIIGLVCMDQIMLDATKLSEIKVGDQVAYFGNPADGALPFTKVAQMAEASPYDLLCRIGNRVERVYQKRED